MRRLLLLLLALLPARAWASGSLTMTATTDSLELLTGAAVSTDFRCSFLDTTSSATTPGSNNGNVATATTTTIVAAPAASTQRKVSGCTIYNRSTTATQTVTIKFDTSGTERFEAKATLLPEERLVYNEETSTWTVWTSSGLLKNRAEELGFNGTTLSWMKLGTASEAAGVRFYYGNAVGFPAPANLGTPGLNGAATDCSTSAGAVVMGTNMLQNPTSGWYLVAGGVSTSVVHHFELIDVLWYNTGIVVTTTTAQNITFPGLPSRDNFGSANGHGVQAALWVSVATTNAGAITNTTISYTDQDGNGGATGAIVSFPATATVGTFVPFGLGTGDIGIRSVQSITLGTSYVTGTIHLVLYRVLASFPIGVANVGANMTGGVPSIVAPGVRLWNGTCLWPGYIGSTTTATNFSGAAMVVDR